MHYKMFYVETIGTSAAKVIRIKKFKYINMILTTENSVHQREHDSNFLFTQTFSLELAVIKNKNLTKKKERVNYI